MVVIHLYFDEATYIDYATRWFASPTLRVTYHYPPSRHGIAFREVPVSTNVIAVMYVVEQLTAGSRDDTSDLFLSKLGRKPQHEMLDQFTHDGSSSLNSKLPPSTIPDPVAAMEKMPRRWEGLEKCRR